MIGHLPGCPRGSWLERLDRPLLDWRTLIGAVLLREGPACECRPPADVDEDVAA